MAADGGANRLHQLSSFQGKFVSYPPKLHSFIRQPPLPLTRTQSNLQFIIGDLDSISDPVMDFYSSQPNPVKVIGDKSQDQTDFQKAIDMIRKEQPPGTDVIALGGLGGRVDQGLRQLHELYLFQQSPDYAEGKVYLLSLSSLTFLLKAGSHRITVKDDGEEGVFGKHVGILPLRETSIISTKGLEWDVTDWETQFGGQISTNNHVLPKTKVVEVTTSRDVLFTIALRGSGDEDVDG